MKFVLKFTPKDEAAEISVASIEFNAPTWDSAHLRSVNMIGLLGFAMNDVNSSISLAPKPTRKFEARVGQSGIILQRGDVITHGSGKRMTFAYACSDGSGRIATQEPGENSIARHASEFVNITVREII